MKSSEVSFLKNCVSLVLAFSLCGVAAAQDVDLFGDLIDGDSNEFTLEIEGDTPIDEPEDMITFDELVATNVGAHIAELYPSVSDPRLVQPSILQDGGRVMQGSVLKVALKVNGPKEKNWRRFTVLFSDVAHPKNELSEDVIYEIDDDAGLDLNWERTTLNKYISHSTLTRSVQFNRSDHENNNSDFRGELKLQTANLKPGNYKLYLEIYRSIEGETVEKDVQYFSFTVVDAPLSIVADLPNSVATYEEDKSAQNVRFHAMLSDWAVYPLMARIESDVPGITLDYGEERLEITSNLFDVLFLSPPAYAGQTSGLKITVRDGLGRVATLRHGVSITDGSSGQIRVDIPTVVDAGDVMRGYITYPDGYTLVKPPFIGDLNGFEWTSSDYTSFKIHVKEEGVDHRRLFAIVARGHVPGVDYEPVLTWKREYDVNSQDLIYDPEEQRRKQEESDARAAEFSRIFVEAMAAGVSSGGSSIDNSGSDDTPSGDSSGLDSTFEIVSTDVFDDLSGTETFEERVSSGSTPSSGRNPSGGSAFIGDGGPPLGDNTTSICGTAINGYSWTAGVTNSGWVIDGNGEDGVSEDGVSFDTVRLIQLGIPYNGDNQYNYLAYYTHNCVLESELIARSDGMTDEYTFYTNGGKKMVSANGEYAKWWDREGNPE